MSVFQFSGPVADTTSSGPKAGNYTCTVSVVEERTSKNGSKYVSLTLTDNEDRSIWVNLFPNSQKEYPQQVVANFCIVAGFYQGGAVNLPSWEALKGATVNVLCRLEDYTNNQGETKKRRTPHSYYSATFLSASEIANGETEAKSFKSNEEWVKANPDIVPKAQATTAGDNTEPF